MTFKKLKEKKDQKRIRLSVEKAEALFLDFGKPVSLCFFLSLNCILDLQFFKKF